MRLLCVRPACVVDRGRHAWVVLCIVILVCSLVAAAPASAATISITPSDDIINTKIQAMNPGDILLLGPGTYSKAGGTSILITNKVGSPAAWFTIKAATPGTVKIIGSSGRNICEIRLSAYWRFEDLELDGQDVAGDGIKSTVNSDFSNDWNHHITLNNLHIHNVTNACVNAQVTTWDLTIQNCWLHDCNLAAYMGNPNGDQQMLNLTFQHNLVERTVGYGMEVKAQNVRTGLTLGTTPGLEFTTWGCLIKDNIWRRTNPPANNANYVRPNFLVDAAPMSGVGSNDLATIDGNVILGNTNDAYGESGMQLSGNLRIINNVVVNVKLSGYAGIKIGSHSGIYPRRLEMLNNTVFIDGSTSSRCLSLFDLQSGYTQMIANNAFIRGDTSAIAVSTGGLPVGAVITNNIVRGTGALAGMTTITTPLSQLFLNPVETPGLINLYPVAGSPLIGAGTRSLSTVLLPTQDFNHIPYPPAGPVDVGAYRRYTTVNPGWQIDNVLNMGYLKKYWLPGDINGDGLVNVADLQLLVVDWSSAYGNPGYDTCSDVSGDNYVNVGDLQVLVANWGLSR